MILNTDSILEIENKKLVFINNNMKIGGVQSSLLNLIIKLSKANEIDLVLFSSAGELLEKLPKNVNIIEAGRLISILGLSHKENQGLMRVISFLFRGITKLINFKIVIPFILFFTKRNTKEYDYAFSYLQDSAPKKFYGGCNFYTLEKIFAKNKYTFIHADYSSYQGVSTYNSSLLKQFDGIALVSKSCKEKFLEILPELKHKATVIKNTFLVDSLLKEADRATFVYEPNSINLLFVGRLAKEKALERFFLAFSRVSIKESKSVKLHLVGDGPMKQVLKALSIELEIEDHVVFHGFSTNPYRFMKEADVLVLPSFLEAAPMVIEEAKILNLKVLTTETCSAREMVPSEFGWVCENSTKGIYEALDIIINN